MEQDKLSKVKIQVEYYFSDQNLEKDRFFHDLISKEANGFLNIDFLLNCNNIKKLAVTKDEIVQAVSQSTVLQLNDEKTMVRRSGNKPLPELKVLNRKRKPSIEEPEEESEDENDLDKIILRIDSSASANLKWKAILEEFKNQNKSLNVVYIRYKDGSGHIGILHKRDAPFKYSSKINIGEAEITVERCEGDDLISFWKEHGKHYEFCTAENSKKSSNKQKDKKKKKNMDRLKEPLELGGEKFYELSKIKAQTRKILSLTKDGEPVNPKDEAFLKSLISFHKNAANKLKDFGHFTAGQPADFKMSRCFFIVKKDGSKEDFSIHKCLERFQN